jgi:uncharacterized membrane protein YqhA
MAKKHNIFESVFETFLFNSRFITMFAVAGSLVASITLFVNGTLQVVHGVIVFCESFVEPNPFIAHTPDVEHVDHQLVTLLVTSVDEYLFATVLLIFSMGIYELFISKIDPASRKIDTRPNWLKINSIDDLKNMLGKVIMMILAVSFFKASLRIEFTHALDVLYLGLGVLFVAGALYLSHASHRHEKHDSDNDSTKQTINK